MFFWDHLADYMYKQTANKKLQTLHYGVLKHWSNVQYSKKLIALCFLIGSF